FPTRRSSDLVVANGVVYVGSDDSNVYALNASDGSMKWKFVTGSVVQFSPSVANGVVYISSSDGNVYAVNAADGSQIWQFTATSQFTNSTPAVANGMVFFGSADNFLY